MTCPGERGFERTEIGNLFLDTVQMLSGKPLHIRACPLTIFVERKKRSSIFNWEAQRAGTVQQGELVCVHRTERRVAVRASCRSDKSDILMISD